MKKGFTLIELLAVIVILAIIALIAVPIVLNIINDARESGYKRSIDNYGKAVEQAIATYQINHPNEEIKGLYKAEDDKLIDSATGDPIEGLSINYDGSRMSSKRVVVYENGTIYMSGCSVGGHSVVDYTYGTPLCELQDGTSKEVSSKYICHLDKDRIFYVLENNKSSENISLIMDRNFTDSYVPVTTAWCTDGGSNNTTCKNINTTGETAPEGKDYIGHITEVFNNSEVTVSFPTASQVALADGKNYLDYPTLSQSWLYGNLNSSSAPYGYWTASPRVDGSNHAWLVSYNGLVFNYNVSNDNYTGVRPVITISKSLLD